MSMPEFPTPNPDMTSEQALTMILSSIALEEVALSHIINAEGEKIQYVLGTLPGLTGPAATIEDLLNTNDSVQRMLESASHNQLFLKSKMQAALSSSEMVDPTGAQGPTGPPGPIGATAAVIYPQHRFLTALLFRLGNRNPHTFYSAKE